MGLGAQRGTTDARDWVADLFGGAKFQEVVQPPTAFRNLGGPKTRGKALAVGVACAMRERRREWPGVSADSIAAWESTLESYSAMSRFRLAYVQENGLVNPSLLLRGYVSSNIR
jgi:hypothetical protein